MISGINMEKKNLTGTSLAGGSVNYERVTNKKVVMFLKIQFLEGIGRYDMFKNTPLKYVHVFSGRQDPWRDGEPKNPKTGKKWGSTMCFAWFVWEHGYEGEPMIKWIHPDLCEKPDIITGQVATDLKNDNFWD